jgi:hypothetical protein
MKGPMNSSHGSFIARPWAPKASDLSREADNLWFLAYRESLAEVAANNVETRKNSSAQLSGETRVQIPYRVTSGMARPRLGRGMNRRRPLGTSPGQNFQARCLQVNQEPRQLHLNKVLT